MNRSVVSEETERLRLRVLVVEDYAEIGEMLVTYFEYRGFEAVVAADGAEALERIAHEPFDAVVVDLGLPKIDGWEIIERLRAEPRSRELPVIAYTGYVTAEPMARAMRAGADAVIAKPATAEHVLDTLVAVFRDRSRVRGRRAPASAR